jgi:lipopolysaccharide transport system permease protein
VIYRALISLAHDIFVVAAVLIYFGIIFKVKLLTALLGFVLVIFTLTWASYVIAIVCVRYRDVIQVMTSVMQAAFFMTPVFWRVDMFPESYRHYLILNPFNVMLTLIRDPLLGIDPPADYWICGFAASAIGFLLSLLLIGKYRRRIVFWI